MNLSHEDVSLFFKLMWALQFYVNLQLDLVPGVESVEAYAKLASEEKLKVRSAMYERLDEFLDAFVSTNPSNLLSEELQIVQRWKHRVQGDFYILRFLKHYTVFVGAKSSKVYGVLGLFDPIKDVLYMFSLPILVKTVLLPFKGRIIYDGLFQPYSISFGVGIRGDLNEIYQTAKQNDTIIESLESGTRPAEKKPKKPVRDWRPVVDGVVETTEQLKQAETVVGTRAFSLLKASARLAQTAAHEPDNLAEIARHIKSIQKTLRQLETALNRAGWYE